MDVVFNVKSSQKHLAALDRFKPTPFTSNNAFIPDLRRCNSGYSFKVLIIYLPVVFYPLTSHLVSLTLLIQTLINSKML